ncbi:hypothetical protein [Streptomyces sp. NBC_01185]|uniref:hypothetical protein n=1 Tax=Streptomyces sp. NBC_01185 TaxID=2903764 RepID=UPI00386A14FC|nr:helix-turn-helix domain-containing protein [Streptomyces sp. NBC_01185]
MAACGMFSVAEFMPHLTECGITLSSSQVHRMASGTPERLSLPVLRRSATSSTARTPT